ncbi:alpha/beta-hydrolase [Linderina pennispora]|uniref:Alpha/beta-hydrolase n=1 Tax=Linderina pennispora TaxID=61395 RepID=A0A1Y1W7K3_9FUNG|nr:alpha/beta-hydrolase [Linderina pennispora]ORX69422.1 alpha/beta-hydrolase [Linderina pennispora]
MPNFDDLRLETSDKVVIRGYLIKRETDEETKRAPTVLYLHANAGNMGHRLPIAKVLYDKLKCNVFMLSYRGYGLSDGQPFEAGIKTDALTALQFLRSNPLTANTKIVAFGQSLGGAVAIDLVSSNQDEFVGLMLENTFLSIPKLIPSVMPLLRYLTFLSWEKWNSEQAIRKVAGVPILFLSGLRDDLVPPPQMRKLFELASREEKNPVTWEEFENGSHNDTCGQEGYFEKIAAWWEAHVVAADPYVPTGRLSGMGTKDIIERSNGTREIIDKDEHPAEPAEEKPGHAKKDD